MDAQSIIMMLLIIAAGVACMAIRITIAVRQAKKHRKYEKREIVVARIKDEKDGIWLCKFFFCGNHLGYFTSEPSANRVKAYVVGYDEKIGRYLLEEFSEPEKVSPFSEPWLI